MLTVVLIIVVLVGFCIGGPFLIEWLNEEEE